MADDVTVGIDASTAKALDREAKAIRKAEEKARNRRYVEEADRRRFSAKNAAVGAAYALADRLGLPIYIVRHVRDVTPPKKYGDRVTMTRTDPNGKQPWEA